MMDSGDASSVDLALICVAAFRPEGGTSLLDEPLTERAWPELRIRVVAERMEGLLASAVGHGVLPVTEGQLVDLKHMARERAKVDLILERETLWSIGILEQACVPYRLLKGPALAHQFYPDPSMRGFGDIDILVEPGSFYRAISALETAGAERTMPELRAGFDGKFGKEATLRSPRGWEIDLHRTTVVGPYGLWSDCREIFDLPPATIELGSRPVPVLSPEASFVFACYNAALADDPPRLVALRDVVQVANSGVVDPTAVSDLARRWRGEEVVRRALAVSHARLGIPIATPGLTVASRPRPVVLWHRAVMASYRGPGRGFTSQLAGVLAVRGMRAKAEYLSALSRPQASYLATRGMTHRRFLSRAARRVRGDR